MKAKKYRNSGQKNKQIMDITPSEEQKAIIMALKANNVIVDAVAGSGKTTTIRFLASRLVKGRILLITYNAALAKETTKLFKNLRITNTDICTYHSFIYRYYNYKCINDLNISEFLQSRRSKNRYMPNLPNYDVLVVDEVQDMTPEYYELIVRHSKDYPSKRYCIIGDMAQNIYRYKNADNRFLALADKLFNFNDKPFKRLPLSVSYRITKPMADLINNVYFGYEKIKAVKNGCKVNYILTNTFRVGGYYSRYIKPILTKFKPEEIFVLAPSVREGTPVKLLLNEISKQDKKTIYIPRDDDEGFNQEEAENKIAFTTFHQSKGRERKCVILFGLDSSYVKYSLQGNVPEICPNPVYVALTRAKECLIILHGSNDFLPFMKKDQLLKNANCVRTISNIDKIKLESTSVEEKKDLSVTNLLRNLQTEDLLYVKQNVPVEIDYDNLKKIEVNGKQSYVNSDNAVYTEVINNILGIAVMLYCERKLTNKCSLVSFYSTLKGKNEKFTWDDNVKMSTNLVNLSIHHECYTTKCYHRKAQIQQTNWFTKPLCEQVYARFTNLKLGASCEFEKFVETNMFNKTISGFIDCIDHTNKIVYEFKFVEELKEEHKVQILLYMNLLHINNSKYKEYTPIVFNIRTGEKWTLTITDEFSDDNFLKRIYLNKVNGDRLPIDEKFLEMIKKIKETDTINDISVEYQDEPEPELEVPQETMDYLMSILD